jgi:ribosomal protein S27E
MNSNALESVLVVSPSMVVPCPDCVNTTTMIITVYEYSATAT